MRTIATGRGGEGGFLLPLALITLSAVLVLGTALFTLARFDLAIARSHEVALRAFYASEAGLATVLAAPPPGPPALVKLRLGEDETLVRAVRLLAIDSTSDLYRIESEARISRPRGGVGRRTLVVLGVWSGEGAAAPRSGSWSELFR